MGETYSVAGAARYLGLTPPQIRYAMHGKLIKATDEREPGTKIARWRISKEDLDEYQVWRTARDEKKRS